MNTKPELSDAASSSSPTAGLLTQKQIFTLDSLTTVSGKVLRDVRFGFETYGQLNDNKDNVIIAEHFFLGNSHVAGKYRPEDELSGYWDALIGPGKAVDTNQFFVISFDTLASGERHGSFICRGIMVRYLDQHL
jgi:homoserine O-acetyltransferase